MQLDRAISVAKVTSDCKFIEFQSHIHVYMYVYNVLSIIHYVVLSSHT